MKKRWIAVPVVLVALVFAGTALAEPEEKAAGACESCQHGGAHGKGEGMRRGGRGLDLTDEQQEKMDELRMAHLKQVRPLETDVELKEMELDVLWRAEKLSSKAIVAKVKEISALRTKIQVARVQHRLDRFGKLTPEQQEKARKMLGRKGGRGMGRGRRMGHAQGMRGMGGAHGFGGVRRHMMQRFAPEGPPSGSD